MADQFDIDELVEQLREFTRTARAMGSTGGAGQDAGKSFDRATERIVQALARLSSQIKKDTVTRTKAERELQDFVKAVDRATDAAKDELDASIKKAEADQKAADAAAALAQAQQDAARVARMSAEERASYDKRKAEELQAERWKAMQAELKDQYNKINDERNYGQLLAKERLKQIDQYNSVEARLGRFGDMIVKSRLGANLSKNAQASISVQMALLRMQSAAESASKTMVSLGKGLLELGDSSKGFTQFNGMIDGVTNALGEMVKAIPFAGEAISGAMKLVAEGSKFVLDRLQKASEAFRELGAAGALTAGGMSELQRQFLESGVSLDDYKRAITENSGALARFGGTVGEGAKRFSKFVGDITRTELGDELRRLGYSAADISDTAGAFVTQQTRLGLAQRKTNAELTNGAAQYAKELDNLAKLTGMQRKEIQAQQDAALSESRFRAKYDELVAQGKEREAKAIMDLQTMVSKASPEMAQGLRDLATGNATTEAAQKVMRMGGQRILQQVEAGVIGPVEAFKQLQTAAGTQLSTAQALSKAVGDETGYTVKYSELSDFYRAKIIDGQVQLDRQQQEQMRKGADPLTDSTVDAQKSMDQLARQMDAFAFAAMPAASKAVEQFTGALNKFITAVAKETGMDLPTITRGKAAGGKAGGGGGGITNARTGALQGGAGAAAGALSMGTAGAAIGSVVPGVGTVIGGGIGAALGGIAGYFGMIDYGLVKRKEEQAKAEVKAQEHITKATQTISEMTWDNVKFAEKDREGFEKYQTRIDELRRQMLQAERNRLAILSPRQQQIERSLIGHRAEQQAQNEFFGRAQKAGAATRTAGAPAPGTARGAAGQIPRAQGGGPGAAAMDLESLFNFGSGTGSRNHFAQLDPAVQQAMINMAAEYRSLTGSKLTINSAYRSPEEQARVNSGGRPRAAPGMSKHQHGLAVDINSSEASFLAQMGLLGKHGFKWGASFGDTPHIYMADGGVIPARPGGTSVVAGEAGKNEAFVPLPDGKSIPVQIKQQSYTPPSAEQLEKIYGMSELIPGIRPGQGGWTTAGGSVGAILELAARELISGNPEKYALKPGQTRSYHDWLSLLFSTPEGKVWAAENYVGIEDTRFQQSPESMALREQYQRIREQINLQWKAAASAGITYGGGSIEDPLSRMEVLAQDYQARQTQRISRGIGDWQTGSTSDPRLAVINERVLAELQNIETRLKDNADMPKMADGGITKGPSIAGEAGPEAVIPLSGNRTIPVELDGAADMVMALNNLVSLQRTNNRIVEKLLQMQSS